MIGVYCADMRGSRNTEGGNMGAKVQVQVRLTSP